MSDVPLKSEVGLLDGTPEKRLFWSIISDYDFPTAICELIDNSIDLWMRKPNRGPLNLRIEADHERQALSVTDDAGGVGEDQLRYLIAPGGSNNDPTAESIGVFGVGSKRAAVALAETITIKTRRDEGKTYQIDITNDWLESQDWNIPHYQIPSIEPGTTQIFLSLLRKPFGSADIDLLKQRLSENYDWFLQIENCDIRLNETRIAGISFDNWAFPPDYHPRQVSGTLDLSRGQNVSYEITGGLIVDRDPVFENYGVYFYCNNRLVCKEVRTKDVGYFTSSEAGVPHPDASLCRVIVRLNGAAKLMPWNSSKSGVIFSHQVLVALRPFIIELTSYFSSLSRRWKEEWKDKVFAFNEGQVQVSSPSSGPPSKPLRLPPLPRVYRPKAERLKSKNKTILRDQPWTLGIVEAIAAVDVIIRQKFETKNRIALLLLDSNFEIALKEFVVHRSDLYPNPDLKAIFKTREDGMKNIASKITIPAPIQAKARHYYQLRNKLVHERATVDITDSDVEVYRDTVETALQILFGLDFLP